jgi:hypothetical protein
MSRKILGNVLLTLVALAIALGLAEMTVRLLFKEQTVLFPRYHTDYQYGRYKLRGIRADSVFHHTSVDGTWTFVTNSKGLRNTVEFPYKKPGGTLRVLSLGDSQTQGYEVGQESTFSAVLENFLNARGVHAEVLDAGVSGFSTAEELAFLENEGYRYEPDVVVLAFYANDFLDNVRAGLFRLKAPDQLVEGKFEYIPGVKAQNFIYAIPGVKWLGENSYFYSLLFNRTWEFFKAQSTSRAQKKPAKDSGAASASNEPPTAGEEFEAAVATPSGHSAYEIRLAIALIKRTQAYCTDKGIRLIVVDVPAGRGPRQFVSSFPLEMQKALQAANVEVVPSEPLFGDFRGAVELHRPHGHHHITEIAHALIGTELGRRIHPPASAPEVTSKSAVPTPGGAPN